MSDLNSIEYYLTNPSFKKWVRDPSEELDAYWQKWVEDNPNSHIYMKEAKQMLLSVRFNTYVISEIRKKNLLNRIEEKVNHVPGRLTKDLTHNFIYYLKIAATFLIIIAAIALVYQFGIINPEAEDLQVKYIVKSTTVGEKLTVKLQDGSLVKLNSGSFIQYPEQFNVEDRTIELQGEAYFEVRKDSTRAFIVKAGNIYIKALGTAFNISNYADDDSISVSLTTGEVLVGKNEFTDSFNLEPGQTASYLVETGLLVKHEFLSRQSISWIDDIIIFKNADWDEIEKRLERWYGVDIVNEKPQVQWDYSGEFKGYSLDKLLKSMCYAKGLNFKIEKDIVRIF